MTSDELEAFLAQLPPGIYSVTLTGGSIVCNYAGAVGGGGDDEDSGDDMEMGDGGDNPMDPTPMGPFTTDEGLDKSGNTVTIEAGKEKPILVTELGDRVDLKLSTSVKVGKEGASNNNITYFNGKVESFEHTEGPFGIKLDKSGIHGTFSLFGLSLGVPIMPQSIPSFSIGISAPLFNSNISNNIELQIRPGGYIGALSIMGITYLTAPQFIPLERAILQGAK